MNRKEAIRQNEQSRMLQSLGFTADEAEALRRISMTLRRWFELECGTDEEWGKGNHVSVSVERDGDEPDSKPYKRVQYATRDGWNDRRYPIADRETGARKRLAAIIGQRNGRPGIVNGRLNAAPAGKVTAYVQTDPRGAALYILRPGDVPEGEDVSSCYSRGICVY